MVNETKLIYSHTGSVLCVRPVHILFWNNQSTIKRKVMIRSQNLIHKNREQKYAKKRSYSFDQTFHYINNVRTIPVKVCIRNQGQPSKSFLHLGTVVPNHRSKDKTRQVLDLLRGLRNNWLWNGAC